jgi:hypothetical protein
MGRHGQRVEAAAGQRVPRVRDTLTMMLKVGSTRVNQVVEFIEGRRIAWLLAEPGQPPLGHLWRWQLQPRCDDKTLVVHTRHVCERAPAAATTTTRGRDRGFDV